MWSRRKLVARLGEGAGDNADDVVRRSVSGLLQQGLGQIHHLLGSLGLCALNWLHAPEQAHAVNDHPTLDSA